MTKPTRELFEWVDCTEDEAIAHKESGGLNRSRCAIEPTGKMKSWYINKDVYGRHFKYQKLVPVAPPPEPKPGDIIPEWEALRRIRNGERVEVSVCYGSWSTASYRYVGFHPARANDCRFRIPQIKRYCLKAPGATLVSVGPEIPTEALQYELARRQFESSRNEGADDPKSVTVTFTVETEEVEG